MQDNRLTETERRAAIKDMIQLRRECESQLEVQARREHRILTEQEREADIARRAAIKDMIQLKEERDYESSDNRRRHFNLFDKIAKDFEVNRDLKYFTEVK